MKCTSTQVMNAHQLVERKSCSTSRRPVHLICVYLRPSAVLIESFRLRLSCCHSHLARRPWDLKVGRRIACTVSRRLATNPACAASRSKDGRPDSQRVVPAFADATSTAVVGGVRGNLLGRVAGPAAAELFLP